MSMLEDEQPHQELVKCVLVGDNAVGKTRLVCARACRQKVSLSQLLNTHVPTVWAIDQYRIYKEVLENSMMVLDGVNVSLRLWDTFGDHHKDRRFAYMKADVVLMCFDVGRVSSLSSCREMWLHQIRRFCPSTPVLLVGCKNDVRFMLKEPQYLAYCRSRSPLVRQVRERDLVMPDMARSMAKEMALTYYETSVLTYFGIDELFENAIRAALCFRRQQRFWMTNLRRVQSPRLQEPHCPPKPPLPQLHDQEELQEEEQRLHQLFLQQRRLMLHQHFFADAVLKVDGVAFAAHRFVLASSSALLRRLFNSDFNSDNSVVTRSNSESSLLSCSGGSSSFFCSESVWSDDTECLLPPSSVHATPARRKPTSRRSTSRRRRRCSLSDVDKSNANVSDVSNFKAVNLPGIASMRLQQVEGRDAWQQTVLSCTAPITSGSLAKTLLFLYTSEIDLDDRQCSLQELRQTAEALGVTRLVRALEAVETRSKMEYSEKSRPKNLEKMEEMEDNFASLMSIFALGQCLMTDIVFCLDDGLMAAHKPMLMARCDVMMAMFDHNFVESDAHTINFPGVSCMTFSYLLSYVYTNSVPKMTASNCSELIALANRLWLPDLIAQIERLVVNEMLDSVARGEEVVDEALRLLQHCQLHRADRLAHWCLSYLAQNYNEICRRHPKVVRDLWPENQAWLNVNRWPPIWYLKDFDLYQRMLADQERGLGLKRRNSGAHNTYGCLCFSNKAAKNRG